MKRLGCDCVYLDITHKSKDFIIKHFPNIYHRCLSLGINMSNEAIPVVPAAHYTCGGVMTDRNARTDIDGLYAIGKVAFTGLHGANRMASNSLLECLVFAHAASIDILAHINDIPMSPNLPDWDESRVTDSDEEVIVSHNWDELRNLAVVAELIIRSAQLRQESRGLHYILDYPNTNEIAENTILTPN